MCGSVRSSVVVVVCVLIQPAFPQSTCAALSLRRNSEPTRLAILTAPSRIHSNNPTVQANRRISQTHTTIHRLQFEYLTRASLFLHNRPIRIHDIRHRRPVTIVIIVRRSVCLCKSLIRCSLCFFGVQSPALPPNEHTRIHAKHTHKHTIYTYAFS